MATKSELLAQNEKALADVNQRIDALYADRHRLVEAAEPPRGLQQWQLDLWRKAQDDEAKALRARITKAEDERRRLNQQRIEIHAAPDTQADTPEIAALVKEREELQQRHEVLRASIAATDDERARHALDASRGIAPAIKAIADIEKRTAVAATELRTLGHALSRIDQDINAKRAARQAAAGDEKLKQARAIADELIEQSQAVDRHLDLAREALRRRADLRVQLSRTGFLDSDRAGRMMTKATISRALAAAGFGGISDIDAHTSRVSLSEADRHFVQLQAPAPQNAA